MSITDNIENFIEDVEETVENSWEVEGKIQQWIDKGDEELKLLAKKHKVTRGSVSEFMMHEYY